MNSTADGGKVNSGGDRNGPFGETAVTGAGFERFDSGYHGKFEPSGERRPGAVVLAQLERKRRREEESDAELRRANPVDGPFRPWFILAIAAAPVAAAWITYGSHLNGPFLFDDVPAVRDNQAIRNHDWYAAAFGPGHSPISNRPLTCLTFALDYGLHGLKPRGYHVFSLMVHLANVALLFGIARRTLRGPVLARLFDPPTALCAAAGLALLWGVHPLSSEAVTYITQRSTLLMSFFMLLAVYCLLRGGQAPQLRKAWDIGAIIACAAGMLCKEEFIAVPILLVLFERAYLFPSWSAMKERWGIYAGLLGSMTVVWICAKAGPSNPTVGYHTVPKATAWEWLMTEAGVVAHYLRLAAIPHPLSGAYDWPIVRNFPEAVVPGVIVLSVLAATIYLWFTRPWWGWPGALFFLLLAPTSSVLPIVTEVIAERRMYLPVLIFVVPTVVGSALLFDYFRRRAQASSGASIAAWFLALAILAGPAMYGAARHASVFDSEAAFWTDVMKWNACDNRSFQAGQILSSYGKVLQDQGHPAEAAKMFGRAMECEAPTLVTRGNYAAALVDMGRIDEGQQRYRELLASDPQQVNPALCDVRGNYAWSLLMTYQQDLAANKAKKDDPRLAEAEVLIRTAIHLQPNNPNFYNTLAIARFHQGDLTGAEQAFIETLKRDPNHVHARQNLVNILKSTGRTAEAARLEREQKPKP